MSILMTAQFPYEVIVTLEKGRRRNPEFLSPKFQRAESVPNVPFRTLMSINVNLILRWLRRPGLTFGKLEAT